MMFLAILKSKGKKSQRINRPSGPASTMDKRIKTLKRANDLKMIRCSFYNEAITC
jgi:hypothetical protein